MNLRPYKSLPLDSLVPYNRNARTHAPEQVDQLVAAITEFGFTNPLLVDEQNRIIAGHGRLEAARRLGMAEVPCLLVEGLTDAQRRALVLADNKLALNAGWDLDLLRSELSDLRDEGFDLGLTGFDGLELAELFAVEGDLGGKDPDDAPELQAETVSQPGDVWVLGAHRVICGDATDIGVLERLLGTEQVDICWVDPPYNVDYEGSAGKIKNDHMADAAFRDLLRSMFSAAFTVMKPGAAIYVAHADTEGLNFRAAFREAGFKLSGCIIWRKESLVLGRSDYQWQHEPILYGWKPGSKHRWYGGRKQTTVQSLGDGSPFVQGDDGRWQVRIGDQVLVVDGEASVTELVPTIMNEPKPKRSADHPTMKPVALIERQLKHNARAGDLVLDFCGGSGSTLIAADRLGMSARLVEIDPRFVDVIVRRWQHYTGRTAVDQSGRSFPEVAP